VVRGSLRMGTRVMVSLRRRPAQPQLSVLA
jgi:hypothetical protein